MCVFHFILLFPIITVSSLRQSVPVMVPSFGSHWRAICIPASIALFSLKIPLSITQCAHSSSFPLPPSLCLGVTLSNKDGRPKRRINHILCSPLLSEQLGCRSGAVTDFSAESIRLGRQLSAALFLESVNHPSNSRSRPLTEDVTIVRPSGRGGAEREGGGANLS